MNPKAGNKKDAEVSKDDQVKINTFSRYNTKYHELEQEIKDKKEKLDALEDAANAIEESFGENLKFFIGFNF